MNKIQLLNKATINYFIRKFHRSTPILAADANTLSQKTCLFDFHVSNGGKIVDFAGWKMPVQYKNLSIQESHMHTRSKCSIFDVSHMMQTRIVGKDRIG